MDLVHVPTFAEQFAKPGSQFASLFSVGERADALSRDLSAERLAAFWAARWAAREAVVKAWSATLDGEPPTHGDDVLGQIEVAVDAWGRPRIVLHGDVAESLAGLEIQLSLSHDGDYAIAFVTLGPSETGAASPSRGTQDSA